MLRARCAARNLWRISQRRSSAVAQQYPLVKFEKEDVDTVMAELPAFNFYEFKDTAPNPYRHTTLDRSILLDSPEPVLSAPKVEVSQLENGLRVASIDKQGLMSRLSLHVHAGSRFENSSNFGVSHMVSMLSYSSTAHLSQLRTVKTLEQLGANSTTSCKAGREEITYRIDMLREFVPLAVPLMIGNVLFPRLLPWEVKASHKTVKEAAAALEKDPVAVVHELLHKAAFCNNTLGLATRASDRSISYFTPETIRSYLLDHFAPERMVLVGLNVSHKELSKWAMRSFADYNAIPMRKRVETPALYTGGELYLDGGSHKLCHLAIAFEGVSSRSPELPTAAVLQSLLGGGQASSNIGSGVTTRLSTALIKQSPFVESCTAFNRSYSDTGLFGIYGSFEATKAGDLSLQICKALLGLPKVSEEELAKAKALLKGKLFRHLDNDAALVQDLGSQLTLSNSYRSPQDLAQAIDAVTAEQVSALAKRFLSGRPTVAAYGDIHGLPHVSVFERALRA